MRAFAGADGDACGMGACVCPCEYGCSVQHWERSNNMAFARNDRTVVCEPLFVSSPAWPLLLSHFPFPFPTRAICKGCRFRGLLAFVLYGWRPAGNLPLQASTAHTGVRRKTPRLFLIPSIAICDQKAEHHINSRLRSPHEKPPVHRTGKHAPSSTMPPPAPSQQPHKNFFNGMPTLTAWVSWSTSTGTRVRRRAPTSSPWAPRRLP